MLPEVILPAPLRSNTANAVLADILAYEWRLHVIRLLFSAAIDKGPRMLVQWAKVSGVPFKKLHPAIVEAAQRCHALKVEPSAEGITLLLRRKCDWRARPKVTEAEFLGAWLSTGQGRLPLTTEEATLFETLSDQYRAIPGSGTIPDSGSANIPGSGIPPAPLNTIDRLIDQKIGTDRVGQGALRDRLSRPPTGVDRLYLMEKLRRMPRLYQEITNPRDDYQRRMARLFTKAEEKDVEWLKSTLGELADRTDVSNKPAWLNSVLTKWEAMPSK